MDLLFIRKMLNFRTFTVLGARNRAAVRRCNSNYSKAMSWTRLIRFVADDGRETFGEPAIENEQQLGELLAVGKLYATEYQGQSPAASLTKGSKIHVKALLDILQTIRCAHHPVHRS